MSDTTLTVKLTRDQIQPWGFRLQGGKDFNSPLTLQKVTSGSLAEKAGLQPGDAILKINGVATENMKHKEAQDSLVQAGNHFEITVQRGDTQIWKPTVTNIASTETCVISNGSSKPITPLTKTSLTAKPQEVRNVSSDYNLKPKPFGHQNGDQKSPALIRKHYNSPSPLYSMKIIDQTLTTQAEVLPTGAVGNNFMKNIPPVNLDSAVYRMILEDEATPPEKPEATVAEDQHFKSLSVTPDLQSKSFKALQKSLDGRAEPLPLATVLRNSELPKSIEQKELPTDGNKSLCDECGRLIVGVFVRIKDKNLHSECFNCATCGTSLRNTGYFNVNDKLYCDVHARLITKRAPSPNILPIVSPSVTRTSPTKDMHIVGVSFQGPQSSNSFNPPHRGPSPTNAPSNLVKLSATTPISVDTTSVHHLQSTTSDMNKQHLAGPKPFSSLTVSAKPVAASHSPRSHRSPTWGASSPVGATTKSIPTAPTHGLGPTSKQGRGILHTTLAPGTRTPICVTCGSPIKGPFVNALGKTWCHNHFRCAFAQCQKPLQDIGFVEEHGQLYCEVCFEAYIAPVCSKCSIRIKGNCLNAIDKQWHPDCFVCTHCNMAFGNSHFFLEDGLPYCEKDWNVLFTTKCAGCGFSIEAGDRWIEALKNSYHSQCFKCTMCQKSLDGQSFYAKGGRPFCKNHPC